MQVYARGWKTGVDNFSSQKKQRKDVCSQSPISVYVGKKTVFRAFLTVYNTVLSIDNLSRRAGSAMENFNHYICTPLFISNGIFIKLTNVPPLKYLWIFQSPH